MSPRVYWAFVLTHNNVELYSDISSSFLPAGGAHHPVQETLAHNPGNGEDTEGQVLALSHTAVTDSTQGVAPQTTSKINVLFFPEFGEPELGRVSFSSYHHFQETYQSETETLYLWVRQTPIVI